MTAYSFLSVAATIVGPGGVIDIGSDSGSSEEGINVVRAGDQNTMTTGAGKQVMHSLAANMAGLITIRFLKTAKANANLSEMFNFQRVNPSLWGQTVINIRDVYAGDLYTAEQCAFKKFADNGYATVGNVLEWSFDVGVLTPKLGSGSPGAGSPIGTLLTNGLF